MTTIILIAFIIIVILFLLETGLYFLTHHPAFLRLLSRKLQNSIGYLYTW